MGLEVNGDGDPVGALDICRYEEVAQTEDVSTDNPSATPPFDSLILIQPLHFRMDYIMGVQESGVEIGGVDVSVDGAVDDQGFLVVAAEDQFGVGNNQEIVKPFARLESCHGDHCQGNVLDLGNGTVEVSLSVGCTGYHCEFCRCEASVGRGSRDICGCRGR